MPKVIFQFKDGSQRTIDTPENTSIMEAAVENGIEEIAGSCGGTLSCATCHVYVHPDWTDRLTAEDNEQSEEEEDKLDECFDIRKTSRLGCQIKLTNALDGLIIALPGTKTDW